MMNSRPRNFNEAGAHAPRILAKIKMLEWRLAILQ